jgi:predicted phosphodiesterase
MAQAPISKEQMLTALKAVQEHGTVSAAARAINVPRPNLARWYERAKTDGMLSPAVTSSADLKAQLNIALARVKNAEKERLTDDFIKSRICKLVDTPLSPPDWVSKPSRKTDDLTGVPMLFLSDVHHGEVVRPEEIGHINSFDVTTSNARIRTYIQVAIALLTKHLANPKYPGCVLMLGGDMVSGSIHEELANTNELEPIPAALDLTGTLVWAINSLADKFGKVHVVGVTGNHGRTSRKPQAKRRNHTNFDWLIYQMLRMQLKGDKRVTFQIPDGPDAMFSVYGTRYLLTHGDQFRGGDGFAGAVVPIARGDRKKRAKHSRLEKGYDVMCLGHWHTYIHTEEYVVNGSVKGYDEYANAGNFDPQEPIQALWITHPVHGMTFRMPVYLDRKADGKQGPWVKA